MTEQKRYAILPLIAIGLVGGLLSGLFGIGGGVIIVPALVLLLVMPQRLAAGTSVAAILPAAVVGAISYAVQGNVDWTAGILLAVGIVIGSQVGALLLSKLPVGFLQWLFLGFLLVVIVSLWFVVPQRDSEISITVLTGAMLAVTGFLTGILSGLIGVGGGIIVVPVLMFFFGANDLVAKGTSLVMMIPGSLSGTLANWRRKNVDLRAAAAVGLAASAASPLGTIIAGTLAPSMSNILFSIFLVLIFTQMLVRLIRAKKN
ncbi:sulfite exporter TauE/SafE family protein [Leucobacter sp. M11]|uniref:sulfite exporter TauE/SafE family protein n=1 Tax=Leucobacter sp. M11 TaxID=2993565 RepID=UPI002D809DD5|nr:sulfite exporter TauE/SafE family protein [Leucobacter sp. M11]MEB4614752.1 sulfite exporter TauE/SafE family protein [Leucobacter sp. M11]